MKRARKKPAPDVFLLALELVNAGLGQSERDVKPEQCLVFENSVAGVEAGRRAGMRVCWVPHRGLRDVYQGKEEKVLMGRTDEEDIDATLNEESMDAKVNDVGHIRSKDGWAEMRANLETFDYAYYGIESRGPEAHGDIKQ